MLLLGLLVWVDLRPCMHSCHPLLVESSSWHQAYLVTLLLRRMVQILQSRRMLDHTAHRRCLHAVLRQELLRLQGSVCCDFQLGVHVLQLLLVSLDLVLVKLGRSAVFRVEVGLCALHTLQLTLLLL